VSVAHLGAVLTCRAAQSLILARKAGRQDEKGNHGALAWEFERRGAAGPHKNAPNADKGAFATWPPYLCSGTHLEEPHKLQRRLRQLPQAHACAVHAGRSQYVQQPTAADFALPKHTSHGRPAPCDSSATPDNDAAAGAADTEVKARAPSFIICSVLSAMQAQTRDILHVVRNIPHSGSMSERCSKHTPYGDKIASRFTFVG